jgi:hypothetical protein
MDAGCAANPRHGEGCGATQHHSYWCGLTTPACGAFFGKQHEETSVLHAASLVEDRTNQIATTMLTGFYVDLL